jgi:hypothetical protein
MSEAESSIPHARCGAKTRAAGRCKQIAGTRTDHLGQGRCWLHGGLSPIKHGRYSSIERKRIRILYDKFRIDPEPLNMHDELYMARAIFTDFVERYELWMEAILAWHSSFIGVRSRFDVALKGFREASRARDAVRMKKALTDLSALDEMHPDTPKPRQILDISDARNSLLVVARIVETIERIRGNVSRGDLERILTEFGHVVQLHVVDDGVLEKIKNGWQQLRLA